MSTAWVAALSPWPEEFGLDRMHALLVALGDPQRAFRAVHVVGTNGKSTATRTIEAHLASSAGEADKVAIVERTHEPWLAAEALVNRLHRHLGLSRDG